MNWAPLVIIGAIVLLPLIWLIATYNRFVSLRHHMRESWSDIDVELKRRYDLIPNLVETVKGYARHERETLESVVALRDQAMSNHGSAEAQARDERRLQSGLRHLFAVAEAYPQLKANANYRALQEELANTEDRIAAARRFYNGNVRENNVLCRMFPTSPVASVFGFQPETFFELDSAEERVVPRVQV